MVRIRQSAVENLRRLGGSGARCNRERTDRYRCQHARLPRLRAKFMLASIHNSVFRDNIEGNRLIEMPDHVRRVVNTREFQRLRNIRQMGLSSYVLTRPAKLNQLSGCVSISPSKRWWLRWRRSRHLFIRGGSGPRHDEHCRKDAWRSAARATLRAGAIPHELESGWCLARILSMAAIPPQLRRA